MYAEKTTYANEDGDPSTPIHKNMISNATPSFQETCHS